MNSPRSPHASSCKQPEVNCEDGSLLLDTESPKKPCKSRDSNICVHFKNTETAQTIKSMHVQKATKNLEDVTLKMSL